MGGSSPRLSPEAVREIREWYARWREIPRPQHMAEKHGVHRSLLKQIGDGLIHKQVQS